ncbi:ATP-binding cassette domain-containing protein [Nocardioides sp.]|uniref:ATP-binding cassette domain-containing protein n=1 Tax=Nocardioides sp. TaxID=35761 RepID=UPI00351343B7
MTRDDVLVADHLAHRYGGHVVFDDLSLSLGAERVGLLGVNGAGKSTLLRILSTSLVPDRGTVRLTDGDGSLSDLRRRIGFMPQALPVPGTVRVGDFLGYLAWLREIPRRRRGAAVATALARTDLTAQHDARVSALSGGMFRRLLLAQAILAEPPVLLLDEPTAGLDPQQRLQLRRILVEQAWLRAVVVSSHSFEDLAPVVTRTVVLHDGRVVFDGPMSELAGRAEEHRREDAPGSAAGSAADDQARPGGLSDLEAGFLSLLRPPGPPT